METREHHALKRLAIAFLLRQGCRAAAVEVRCPKSKYRVDAAGYLDAPPLTTRQEDRSAGTLFQDVRRPRRLRPEPQTVIIECKQARSDFLRDSAATERLLRIRDRLNERLAFLERNVIRQREPHLRRSGSALFPELEAWDFAGTSLRAYHSTLERLQRIEERLHGETKFCTAARHRLADRMYLLTPKGLLKPRETPPGWGLIECPRRLLSSTPVRVGDLPGDAVRLVVEPAVRPCAPEQRVRLLRNIAVAATAAAMRAQASVQAQQAPAPARILKVHDARTNSM